MELDPTAEDLVKHSAIFIFIIFSICSVALCCFLSPERKMVEARTLLDNLISFFLRDSSKYSNFIKIIFIFTLFHSILYFCVVFNNLLYLSLGGMANSKVL